MSTTTEGSTSVDPGSTPPPAMGGAKVPVGNGVVSVAGIVLAVLVTGLGFVAVWDGLKGLGLLSGTPWSESAVSALDGLEPATWLVPAGLLLLLLGLLLLVAALRRRPRKAVALRAETGVFLRPRDLRSLAATAARDVDGVLSARVTADLRRVSVRVVTTGAPSVGDDVRAAVEQRLAPLERTPRISVRTTTERTDR